MAESLLDLGRYYTQVSLYLCDLQITIQAARRHLLSRQYLSFALFNFMTDRDTGAGPTERQPGLGFFRKKPISSRTPGRKWKKMEESGRNWNKVKDTTRINV